MKNKLFKASLAGVAVVALAAGGGTFAAWSDFGEINDNTVGAGFLKLNLNDQTGSSGPVALDWGNLAPGNANSERRVWIASNDGDSVPNGHLYVTFSGLDNQENGCSSNSESVLDPTCEGDAANSGELSRQINFQSSVYPDAQDANACATWPGQGGYASFWASNQGNLTAVASGAGTKYQVKTVSGSPMVLQPGDGVCIGISSWWPLTSNQVSEDSDNKAQGDSLSFDIRFDLVQAS